MTARELIQRLQAVDEKSLDMNVYVRPTPPGGGYAGIEDVSVIYAGHAIIHLAGPPPDIDKLETLIQKPVAT